MGLQQRIDAAYALAAHVPFGQSEFQNAHLADDSLTPERRLRHALLQLDGKLKALKDCDFRRRRLDVVLRARRRAAALFGWLPWAGELLQIGVEEIECALEREAKLIGDAYIEVETFVGMIEALPIEVREGMTRERFELAERKHFVAKLTRAAELELLGQGGISVGTLEALEKVGIRARRLEGGALQLEDLQKNKQ